MRVLQTLGRHKKKSQEGIFQYKRTASGVYIDLSVGQASPTSDEITFTTDEWQKIIDAVHSNGSRYYRLTRTETENPPKQSLYDTIADAVPSPQGGWKWSDIYLSCVAAILEHEGSVDLYGGLLGPGQGVPIVLAADT